MGDSLGHPFLVFGIDLDLYVQCRMEWVSMSVEKSTSYQPWWRFGHVWLIIAGPVLVIMAGIVTFYLAVSSPNEIVSDATYRQSIESNRNKGATTLPDELAPALQGRNHAATGVVPLPK